MTSFLLILFTICCVLNCLGSKGKNKYSITHLLLYTIPDTIIKIGNKLIGTRFGKKFHDILFYLFKTNNPLIMIFYLLISPGCYALFIGTIMIPYYHLISTWLLIIGNLNVVIGFYLYYLTCMTDPGTITFMNHKLYLKKYEDYMDE